MPRDLQELKNGLLGDKPSVEKTGDEKSSISAPPAEIKDRITRDMERDDQINEVKPYVQTLNLSDVDSCLKLEQAVFPPNEQASREKVSCFPISWFGGLHSCMTYIVPWYLWLYNFLVAQE